MVDCGCGAEDGNKDVKMESGKSRELP